MIVVVMGVSGSGKTTVGRLLAERLGWRFIEGDDYHPKENVAKMAAGVPLEDADRWPWLDALNRVLKDAENAVLACSALKEIYRRRLLHGVAASRMVYLRGSNQLIAERVAARKHRYMPASLLDSQFAALEPPREAIEVDVSLDPEACVARIMAQL